MAVEVGDVLRIAARMRLAGIGDIINVYNFVVAVNGFLNDGQVMDAVANIMDDLYTTINQNVHQDVAYESIEGLNVTKSELLPDRDWPLLVAGANITDMLPEMNAACCFFRTITPKVRASKFLPPFGVNTQTDGALNAVPVTEIEAFGDFLVAPIVETSLTLGYVSRNRVTGIITSVSSRVVPARFRTQRNRRLGVGS